MLGWGYFALSCCKKAFEIVVFFTLWNWCHVLWLNQRRWVLAKLSFVFNCCCDPTAICVHCGSSSQSVEEQELQKCGFHWHLPVRQVMIGEAHQFGFVLVAFYVAQDWRSAHTTEQLSYAANFVAPLHLAAVRFLSHKIEKGLRPLGNLLVPLSLVLGFTWHTIGFTWHTTTIGSTFVPHRSV